jgi:gamma-butyrobetaine dioxygenase
MQVSIRWAVRASRGHGLTRTVIRHRRRLHVDRQAGQAQALEELLALDQSVSHAEDQAVEIQTPKGFDQPSAAHWTHIKPHGSPDAYPVSPILLRDMCQCPACRDPSTRQKLFSTADIPAGIRDASIESDESGVHVTWTNDIPGYPPEHRTTIPTSVLSRMLRTGSPTSADHSYLPGRQVTWDAGMMAQFEDFDYAAYMEDDGVLLRALKQLHTHGLLFVSKVPEDEHSVEYLANRIGPIKNTFYGSTWDVRSVPDSKNVAYTSQDLGFHMDLLYLRQPPHIQLLHCIRSSSTGGASLFTDSYRTAEDMFSNHFDEFTSLTRREVNFYYDHGPSHLYHQTRNVFELLPMRTGRRNFQDIRQFREWYEQGRSLESIATGEKVGTAAVPRTRRLQILDYLNAVNWSPPFQAPFALRQIGNADALDRLSAGVNEWHGAAQTFSRLIHRPEGIYERLMKPGECVIFDNRRVLHARRAFDVADAGKERWLRGTYVDKDPYLSRLRTLHLQLEGKSE